MASKPSSAATRVSSALPERVALVPVSNVSLPGGQQETHYTMTIVTTSALP